MLPMTRDDIENLKQVNPIKYFEVLPDQLMLRVLDFASKTGFFNQFKSTIIDELVKDKDGEMDKISTTPINFKKAAIGGIIYLVGNIVNKHMGKMGVVNIDKEGKKSET
jgi:hypothetical protein